MRFGSVEYTCFTEDAIKLNNITAISYRKIILSDEQCKIDRLVLAVQYV
jgi:hypothetical protein